MVAGCPILNAAVEVDDTISKSLSGGCFKTRSSKKTNPPSISGVKIVRVGY